MNQSLFLAVSLILGASAANASVIQSQAYYCGNAKFVCASTDELVTACVFEKSQGDFMIYANSTSSDAPDKTGRFDAVLAPATPGVRGAPRTFVGNDVNLAIQTNAFSPTYPGKLSAPSLGIADLAMACKKQN